MKFLLINQETDRLKFRQLEDSDFENWLELFNDDETAQLLGMTEYKSPRERCEKWFEWTFHRYENNLGGQNVLILKETGEIIGQAGLLVREINDKNELEVAYSILPKFRRKGFATEASRKCKDFAFENNFNERLISIIVPENENSKKVALKNGLQFDKKINFHGKEMEIFLINKKNWAEK